MAKVLLKKLEDGKYTGSIVGIKGYTDIDGARTIVDFMTDENMDIWENANCPKITMYSLRIKLADREITTNKFDNRIVWTDKKGIGWTSLEFFTSGLQRQLGLENETDDVVIMKSAVNVDFWISEYNQGAESKGYNVDTRPNKVQVAKESLGLEF